MPLVVLFLLFVAEVAALVAVGSWLGVGWTVLLFVGTSFVGGAVLRSQGRRTVVALREAQRRRSSGGRELADGALGGVGAVLLVLPGFVTDILGLLLLLPPTQALLRPVLASAVARRVMVMPNFRTRPGGADVVEGEVVSTDDPTGAGWSRPGLTGPEERPRRR